MDAIVFPELAVCGYPPEDLLFTPSFLDSCEKYFRKVVDLTEGMTAVIGFAEIENGKTYNSVAVVKNKTVEYMYRKHILPNYGVFDEKRYFKKGTGEPLAAICGVKCGISICEDIWHKNGPAKHQAQKGASFLINLSFSPYHMNKYEERVSVLKQRVKETGLPIFYCNAIGGQDELVFDGNSFVLDSSGEIISKAKAFEEDLLITELKVDSGGCIVFSQDTSQKIKERSKQDKLGEVYKALVLGLRDYVTKNNFKKVCIGLSGGIDSCLVAAIAADALGAESVKGIFMPSKFTSDVSVRCVQKLKENLGIDLDDISIEPIFEQYKKDLGKLITGNLKDITLQNIQARIRGNILMALSNNLGYLVLSTGNKSEFAVGYTTLYGDMAGGFAVIKDIYKTLVYELATYRNEISDGEVIPAEAIERPPSAELSEGQLDSDSLPDYCVLDEILKSYVEDAADASSFTCRKHGASISAVDVNRIINMVDFNEYKRRQAPIGIKITSKAFGRDRRFPITQSFKRHSADS